MPNASRYLQPGYTYHLTHRCHDRRYLLRTIRERDDYRKWLREGARRYGVPVYNYSVTSNHVHVIAHADDVSGVSSMMQLAAATVARHWNRLKGHDGSFWEHPCLRRASRQEHAPTSSIFLQRRWGGCPRSYVRTREIDGLQPKQKVISGR